MSATLTLFVTFTVITLAVVGVVIFLSKRLEREVEQNSTNQLRADINEKRVELTTKRAKVLASKETADKIIGDMKKGDF